MKGMASDLDAHAIPSENYQEAVNARIVSRSDNLFSLKNIPGMKEMPPIGVGGFKIKQKNGFLKGVGNSTTDAFLYQAPRHIKKFNVTITYVGGTTATGSYEWSAYKTSNSIIRATQKGHKDVNKTNYTNIEYTNNQYMGFLYQAITSVPDINTYYDISLKVPSSTYSSFEAEIWFTQKIGVKEISSISVAFDVGTTDPKNIVPNNSSYFKVNSTFGSGDSISDVLETTNGAAFTYDTNQDQFGYFGKCIIQDNKSFKVLDGAVHANPGFIANLNSVIYSVYIVCENWGTNDEIEVIIGDTTTIIGGTDVNGLGAALANATKIVTGTGSNASVPFEFKAKDGTLTVRHFSIKAAGGSYTLAEDTFWETETFTKTYTLIDMCEFSEYLCVLAHHKTNDDAVFKFEFDTTGSCTNIQPLIFGDFGFNAKTSIRLAKIEENDAYERIYWTDGVNPLRGLNILGDHEYYAKLAETGLNVIQTGNLQPPVVNSIIQGGALPCGSYSYCYRLMTGDGKMSTVSPISNPVSVYATNKSNQAHAIQGGDLDTISGKIISLGVSNIDTTFTRIQVIAIRFISQEGAAICSVIADEKVFGDTMEFFHTGNSPEIPLTLYEVLAQGKTWDSCKTLAIKDNRLFAGNLTNTSYDLGLTSTSFRVVSYRNAGVDGAYQTWDYAANGYDIPDSDELGKGLFAPDHYMLPDDATVSTNKYRYIKLYDGTGTTGQTNDSNSARVFGYETPNFGSKTTDIGVRVTFGMKEFTLDDDVNNYYRGQTENGKYATAPFYGPNSPNEDSLDGFYNNYKNPLFAQNYTGYMRGEIYRFGIQFYDKGGESTFVYPIGDIRMPDMSAEYRELRNDGEVYSALASVSLTSGVYNNTDATITHAGSTDIRVGMSVTSDKAGIPANSYVASITSNTVFELNAAAESSQTGCVLSLSTSGTTLDSDLPKTYLTCNDKGKGYILFPEFRVKLPNSIRSKISGYSIVRVHRDATNSTVQFSGAMNQTMYYANSSDNGIRKNKICNTGFPQVSLDFNSTNGEVGGSGELGANATLINPNLHTIDTPEALFGTFDYNFQSNDYVKVCGVLNAFLGEDSPVLHTDNNELNILRADDENKYYGGGYLTTGLGTEHASTRSNTFYSKYYIDDTLKSGLNLITPSRYTFDDLGSGTFGVYQELTYASKVGQGEEVISSKLGDANISHNYRNGCGNVSMSRLRLGYGNTDGTTKWYNTSLNGYRPGDYDRNMLNNTSVLAATRGGLDGIDTNAYIYGKQEIQRSDLTGNPKLFVAQKLLCKVYRRFSSATLYGGSSESSYENQKYNATGTYNFDLDTYEAQNAANSGNSSTVYYHPVFGGDTFVTLFGLSKNVNPNMEENRTYAHGAAIVFPVETRINTDLRWGDYFGAPNAISSMDIEYEVKVRVPSTEPSTHYGGATQYEYVTETRTRTQTGGSALMLAFQDEYLYNNTYNVNNSLKSFSQKPSTFVEVNDFKNVIAASNLKLAGDFMDAFSRFDVNEFFEVDMAQGPVYNLFNFKNELFVIQKDAVGLLSVNPRALISAEGAPIQVATGSGNVMQRIDYLDTKYGSQHYNNGVTTNKGLYWFDDNQSAFCMLQYSGKGAGVTDILETTHNSNLLFSLRNYQVNDNPKEVSERLIDQRGKTFSKRSAKTNISSVGGVHLYWNQLYNEVGLCITGLNTAPNYMHIVYDELLGVISSKRSYKTVASCSYNGRLYSLGYEGNSANLSKYNLFLHDESSTYNNFYDVQSGSNFKVKFVCNEDVFTTKVFDKLVMYLTGNQNSAKLTKFTFTDSLGNTETLTDLTHAKMKMGKHIIPIRSKTSSTRLKGDFITIEAECSGTTEEIEIFSALTHFRKMQL